MSINLSKGQKIAIGQTNLSIGLGWTPNQSTTGKQFDLDCSVFLLDGNKFIPSDKDFVFYNNLKSPDGAVEHSGDCRSGNKSDAGDDETIKIDVAKLNPEIKELVFVVSIDDAAVRAQTFGQIRNSYIRIVDNDTGAEIAKYELDEDFSIETSIEFGRLYLKDGKWKFDPTGIGYKEDLSFFVSKYYSGMVNK